MPFKELWQVQARIIGYITPYWKIVGCGFALTIFVALARLSQAKFVNWLFALMTGESFSYQSGQDPFGQLNLVIGGFLLLLAAMGAGSFFQKYLVDLAGQSALRDLRESIFKHLQRLDLEFFEASRAGEVQSRLTSDVLLATSVYALLADFLKNLIIVSVALGWMFWLDLRMTGLVLLLSPLIAIAVGKFGEKAGRITTSLQGRVAELASVVFENVSNQKIIKGFNRENFEIARFSMVNKENFRTQMRLVQVAAAQIPVIEVIAAVGIVVIVYFGAARVLQGAATFGQMTEYWTLLVMTTQPVSALSNFYSSLQSSAAAGKRVFQIIDAESKIKDGKDELQLLPGCGRIEFKNVYFGYRADEPILRGIDLEVRAGEVIAIVGLNGAGKTSFVNLLPRYYDPSAGSICIDGFDLRTLSLSSLRTNVSSVIQESAFFAGTIADNIACGRQWFSREDIIRAAKIANADEFIAGQPDGYDTQVGERGLSLSGGQRQRIAIARALLGDPKVLVLDEFTAGIDTESENLITEAIERVMRGRTCFIIAHRLNTIRNADRIIVLDSGKIVESGTHEKLLTLEGLYRRLYEAQLRTAISIPETERKGA